MSPWLTSILVGEITHCIFNPALTLPCSPAAVDKANGRSAPKIIDSFWETAVYVGAVLVGVLILLQFRDPKESEISKAEYFLAGYVFPIWVTRAYGRYRHGHQLWYVPP